MTLTARSEIANTNIARAMPPTVDVPPRLALVRHDEPVTLCEFLKSTQPFCVRQRLSRNVTIYGEGDSTDQIYEVVSGTVRLCKHTPGGRRHVLDFVMAGELFGLLEHSEHTMSAETVGEVVIASYARNRLDKLAAENSVVRRRIQSAISDNLLTAQQQLLVLGCQDARERLASFFLRLAERIGLKPGNRLELPMGRKDIADHLGLTIETICRTVRILDRAGIVSVPNAHEIVLRDLPSLRALAVEG